GLDVRAVEHIEAEPMEHSLERAAGRGDRVDRAGLVRVGAEAEIDPARELALAGLLGDPLALPLDRDLHPALDGVEQLPQPLALVGRDLAQRLPQPGDRSLLAQELDLNLVDRGLVFGRIESLVEPLPLAFEQLLGCRFGLFGHRNPGWADAKPHVAPKGRETKRPGLGGPGLSRKLL